MQFHVDFMLNGRTMLDLKRDITSLSNFQRNTREFLQGLKESARPLVLTVNGKAELVVQDAEAYQRLLDRAAGKVPAEG